MSGAMLLTVSLSLYLMWATGGTARSGAVILQDALDRGPVSLNDMFREVEELMEDTRHILEEAVDQITTESAKSSLTSLDLLPNYHNITKKMIKDGRGASQILDRIDKETNNRTGEAHLSHIHMEVSGQWNSVDHVSLLPSLSMLSNCTESGYVNSAGCWEKNCQGSRYVNISAKSQAVRHTATLTVTHTVCHVIEVECIVDEDCGDQKYCLYETENSKCLPCIPTDMPCTKDEECCLDQMCVWGQCTVNATAGTEGTICQGQSDCRPDLCCAFQRELLFPVCNPKPGRGESCWNHPNLLMDMLAWDQEGPRDHCPCADDLQCQPRGRGSVCGE